VTTVYGRPAESQAPLDADGPIVGCCCLQPGHCLLELARRHSESRNRCSEIGNGLCRRIGYRVSGAAELRCVSIITYYVPRIPVAERLHGSRDALMDR